MASKKKQEVSFEKGMLELEEMIAAMSDGSLSLEEAMAAYEKGMALCSHLTDILQAHEKRIEQIDLETGEIKAFEG